MTGHRIPLKGFNIDKDGKLKQIARDASAKLRQRPNGSKRVRVARAGVKTGKT